MVNKIIYVLFVAQMFRIYDNFFSALGFLPTLFLFGDSSHEVLLSLYFHMTNVLAFYGVHHGAFKKYISPTVVYFILFNLLIFASWDVFKAIYFMDYYGEVKTIFIVVLNIIYISMLAKVILASKKNLVQEHSGQEHLKEKQFLDIAGLPGIPDLTDMVETKRNSRDMFIGKKK